jgi:hypothetical protein
MVSVALHREEEKEDKIRRPKTGPEVCNVGKKERRR